MSVFEILGPLMAEQVKAKAAIVEFLAVLDLPVKERFEKWNAAIDKLRESV